MGDPCDSIAEQILIGSLLGDGSIQSGYYREKHSFKQGDYLKWKNHFFDYKYSERIYRNYRTSELLSRKKDNLVALQKIFYKDEKKSVTKPFIDKLEALGILVWYLDAGTYNYWSRTASIHVGKYNLEAQAIIVQHLHDQWGLFPQAKKGHLRFNAEQTELLFNIIYPIYTEYSLPHCMTYKMGHFAPENKSLAEKRKSARRVSVYIQKDISEKLLLECLSNNNREIFGLLYGTYPRREITSYKVIPFPSNRNKVEFDPKAVANIPTENCIGWFHSHVKDSDMLSPTDIRTHIALFNGNKYIAVVVNVPQNTYRIYDHIKPNGEVRLCQPVLNDHYTRLALPDNVTLKKHLNEEKLTVKEIADLYDVSKTSVYNLLRRQGIPFTPNP